MGSHSFLEMRRRNALSILAAVRGNQEISRADLARVTNLSPATVSNIVDELLSVEILFETGVKESARGRRPIGLIFNAQSRFVAGLSLAPEGITAVLCDLNGQPILESTRKFPSSQDVDELTSAIVDLLKDLVKQAGGSLRKIGAAGIALPGPIGETHRGKVTASDRGIHAIAHRELWVRLQKKLKCPAVIDSFVNMAAIAETSAGAAQCADSVLCVRVGQVVRSAMIIQGNLITGRSNLAGELGHLPVPGNSRDCPCGGKGCINTLAAESALIEACRARGVRVKGVEEIVGRADQGNDVCKDVIAAAAAAVGYGAAICVNILAPNQIILSGDIVEAGAVFLVPLYASVKKYAVRANLKNCYIGPSELQHNREALGAALKALSSELLSMLAEMIPSAPITQVQ